MDRAPTPRARISWISPADPAPGGARRALESAGYALASSSPADATIIDLRGGATAIGAAQRSAHALRRNWPDCAIVYLADPEIGAAERAFLRRTGELVLTRSDLAPAVAAIRHRLRIRNIAEEAGERLKSIAALTRLSEFPPIDTSSEAPSVLVAGAPGAPALAVIAAASAVSSVCDAALSAAQAMRALESGLYDCAVFLPKSAGDPLLSLARAMRRHRRLQEISMIVVAGDPAPLRAGLPSDSEALSCAHAPHDLGARILTLTRRARLLTAMRRFLSACAGDGVRDRVSGAFTPGFFGQHAERIYARAAQTGRPASLIGVRLAASEPDDPDIGGVRTSTEAARLIKRLTRAEDCVGRISSDAFLVLQSATPEADAERAARRIAGVIANTMFRSRGGKKLFSVAAATAAIERRGGERLEETVSAVLAQLKAARPRAAQL